MSLIELLLKTELTFPGILDDWLRIIILYILLVLLFGHSLEKVLEKKHLAAHSLGLLITLPIIILIFFLFYFMSTFFNVKVILFYNSSYLIVMLIAFKRLFHHFKNKKNN